jgi:hypothetical protein
VGDDRRRQPARGPANINDPDKIAFGLTFRRLASAGLGGPGIYRSYGRLLPTAVWITAAIIVFAIAVVVALGRRGGLPLDVWLRHGLPLSRSPRTLTLGTARASSVAFVAGSLSVPAPLRSPATTVSRTGVLTTEGKNRVLIAAAPRTSTCALAASRARCSTGSAGSSTA